MKKDKLFNVKKKTRLQLDDSQNKKLQRDIGKGREVKCVTEKKDPKIVWFFSMEWN